MPTQRVTEFSRTPMVRVTKQAHMTLQPLATKKLPSNTLCASSSHRLAGYLVRQQITNLGLTAKPTDHARGHALCKVYHGSKSVLMCLFFSCPGEAGLLECPSQDRRGQARTLPTHLPSPDDARFTARALHPTCGRPREVKTVGGGLGLPLHGSPMLRNCARTQKRRT